MNKPKPRTTAIDRYIGCNIRSLRRAANLSQRELAAMLGVSFQQIQKYEKGQNRLSAANLYKLGQEFGIPYDYFFPQDGDAKDSPRTIIHRICTIKDKTLRRKIVRIIEIMASP